MRHTPGPWHISEQHPWNIKSQTGHIGSATFTGFQPTLRERDEVCANARLMAAAPDLHAACEARLACDEEWDQGTEQWRDAVLKLKADEMMRAALAKASGK